MTHRESLLPSRRGWWTFRYGFSFRIGHLFMSFGVYPTQKYPSDWRPVVIEWKDRCLP